MAFGSGPYGTAFYQAQMAGSYRSAKKVLTRLFERGAPSSVIDFGCGVGTWLRASLDLGASRVLGLDGNYIDRSLLTIPASMFRSCDLSEGGIDVGDRFDLAISLEVAEHLPPHKARAFVGSICATSDMVLFAAAVPGQRGTRHVNEQFPSFWIPVFAEYGFQCFDFLRPEIWCDAEVEVWYRQNALVFAKNRGFPMRVDDSGSADLIHPELWLQRGNALHGSRRILSVTKFEVASALPQSFKSFLRRIIGR